MHFAAHSDQRPFKCDICEFRALTRNRLKQHVATHSDERPFKCDTCDYRFRTRGNLKQHVATHSDERPFKCDICDYHSRTRGNLKLHVATHSDERPFKCDICEFRSRRRWDLKIHVATHSIERSFKCNICDYRGRTRKNLKKHVSTHRDERPFKCDICQYSSRTSTVLKKHATTHSDERPFKCDICEYRAQTRINLMKHLNNHRGERPFKCDMCDYHGRTRGGLKQHVVTHRYERPFRCTFCDYAAKLKKSLRVHIARRHLSKSGTDRKIKKSVASKRKNKYDQSKLTRKCRFCVNVFNRRESLISHENFSRKFKGERISMKDNAEKPNQGNMEANLSRSNQDQSESRSTGVADFVLPLKLKSDGKRGSSQPKRSVPNINHDSRNESNQSEEVEIHSESDPDEPRNARDSNCTHSEHIGSNLNQGISLNTWPSKWKLNTIHPTIISEEIKKEPEPLSNDNFSSEFHINCIKLENEAAMPLPAKNQFANKRCAIVLTKLEDLGEYHGCYYIRMKEAPNLYEVVKVILNPVI